MYIEILKAPSILSLTLQEDGVDIVQGLKQILKSASALQTLAKRDPKNWSTVKLIQWNLRIKDTLGAEVLSSFRRLSSGGRFEPIGHL